MQAVGMDANGNLHPVVADASGKFVPSGNVATPAAMGSGLVGYVPQILLTGIDSNGNAHYLLVDNNGQIMIPASGGTATLPANLTGVATDSSGTPKQITALPASAITGLNSAATLGVYTTASVSTTPFNAQATTAFVTVFASAAASALVVNLPSGASAGQIFAFKKTDATNNKVSVNPPSGKTIDGSTTAVVISTQLQGLVLQCDASGNYWIIADY